MITTIGQKVFIKLLRIEKRQINNIEICVKISDSTINFNGASYPCQIGIEGGVHYAKGAEGDKKTPIGNYKIRFGFYRKDRVSKPHSLLNFIPINKNDGWSDDTMDESYNRYIRLPCSKSHERLWREDRAYDIILVINHNDSPPVPGLGTAIFIHQSQIHTRKTQGSVAIEQLGMYQFFTLITTAKNLYITH